MTRAKRHTRQHRARRHGHWPKCNHAKDQHLPAWVTPFHDAAHSTAPNTLSPSNTPTPTAHQHTPPAYTPRIPTPPPTPPHAPHTLSLLTARDIPKPGSTAFTLAIAIVLAAFTSLLAAVFYCCFKWIRRRREKKAAAAKSNGVHWGNVDYHMQRDWGLDRR